MYHALQEKIDEGKRPDLSQMDAQINILQEEVQTLKASEKSLRSSLSIREALVSLEQLRCEIVALEGEKSQLLARLEPLRQGKSQEISTDEKDAVEIQWNLWHRVHDERRLIAREFWSFVSENLPDGQTKSEFWVCLTRSTLHAEHIGGTRTRRNTLIAYQSPPPSQHPPVASDLT